MPPQQNQLTGASSIEGLLRSGRKIEAIKVYRQQTGIGLKEAKDAVDAMEKQLRRWLVIAVKKQLLFFFI